MKASKYLTYCLGIVALAFVFMPACGGGGEEENLPEIDCNVETPVAFAEVTLLAETCTACHSSTLSGAERLSAPVGVDYDIYSAAAANATIGVEEVYGGTMPPAGIPAAEADKKEFYVWALCGQPQ